MSANLLFSKNDTFPQVNVSSNIPVYPYVDCFMNRASTINYSVFFITSCLLLFPLFILVLYLGFQQWRQWWFSSTATMMSPSDSFTYQMVLISLFSHTGIIVMFCGLYQDNFSVVLYGYGASTFFWQTENYFHLLACLERYLAVVHPIIYVNQRRERKSKIRNISIGCVWLLCIGRVPIAVYEYAIFVELFMLIISVTIVSFCSFSVLYVLIHPGPGNGAGQHTDKSKLRAFCTSMATLVVLILRFIWSFLCVSSYIHSKSYACLLLLSGCWVNFPGNFVFPLLFLRRAGTFPCWSEDKE